MVNDMNRKIRSLTRDQLLEMYVNHNMTISEIADITGFSKTYVNKLRYIYGIKTIKKARRTAISKKELEYMYNELKMTDKEISRKVGIHEITVGVYRKHFGITSRQTQKKQKNISKIISYIEDNANNFEIQRVDKNNLPYSLLVNGKRIKIIQSNTYKKKMDKLYFQLTYKKYQGIENDLSKNDYSEERYKVIFSEVCDFVIFLNINSDFEFWVFKSKEADNIFHKENTAILNKEIKEFQRFYMNIEIILEDE